MKPFKLNLMRDGYHIHRLNKIGIKLIVDLKIYLCLVALLIELDSFKSTQSYSLK